MILYLDTSALVKLFIDEDGREIALDRFRAASSSATSVIAYTECRAALARRQRAGDFDRNHLSGLVARLDEIWPTIRNRQVSGELAHLAGYLAEAHALRGYDAVHLASALVFTREFDDLEFLSFDVRLNEAARAASLRVVEDNTDSAIAGEDR